MPSARGHGSLASKSLVELMEERSRETKSEKVSYFAGPFDRSGLEEGIQGILPEPRSLARMLGDEASVQVQRRTNAEPCHAIQRC